LFPELAGARIALHDIDPVRLDTSARVAGAVAEALQARPVIDATTDRRLALGGADYVITMFQVGGYRPATVTDFEIPKRHGLRQTIGDTLGIGGIMRGLRTIPVLGSIAADMEQLCPEAWLLNYVNPMSMNCWALSRTTKVRTVGLCHSVYWTAWVLARDIGVPFEEVSYVSAGLNHLAFLLRFSRAGEDLYPLVRKVIEEGRVPKDNRVRYEVFRRLGYFPTESSEHLAEYVPWFIKPERPDLIERFAIPLDEYPRRCEAQEAGWEALRRKLQEGGPLRVHGSPEYAPQIIHSIETGTPRVVYGNVPNEGLVGALPAGCCVEVPCLVDASGVQPVVPPPLPPQLVALMRPALSVQELTVEAVLTGRRDHVVQAAMVDPHTGSQLDLDQIDELMTELLAAHAELVPPLA